MYYGKTRIAAWPWNQINHHKMYPKRMYPIPHKKDSEIFLKNLPIAKVNVSETAKMLMYRENDIWRLWGRIITWNKLITWIAVFKCCVKREEKYLGLFEHVSMEELSTARAHDVDFCYSNNNGFTTVFTKNVWKREMFNPLKNKVRSLELEVEYSCVSLVCVSSFHLKFRMVKINRF